MKNKTKKKIIEFPNAIYFHGKEIIPRKECPKGKIYFINEKNFKYSGFLMKKKKWNK